MKVVCALVAKGDKFLIAQRPAHKSNPLLWEFPGGKVEVDETETDAIKREIREELGIEVQAIERLASINYNNADKAFVLICWRCDWVTGEISLLEHANSQWIGLDELEIVHMCPADVILAAALKKLFQKQNKRIDP